MQEADEAQPVTIADPWPQWLRRGLRQCEMLRGDATGPKGRCEEFVVMTAYWQGRQLRVCGYHGRMCKRLKALCPHCAGAHESAQCPELAKWSSAVDHNGHLGAKEKTNGS